MTDPIITSDLPYLTKAEQLRFKLAREQRRISFFKLAKCAECSQDIPKTDHKKYCSSECYARAGGDHGEQEVKDDSEW